MWNCCCPMLIHMLLVPVMMYGSRVNPMPVTQKSVAVIWLGILTLTCSSATMLPMSSAARSYVSPCIVSSSGCRCLLHDGQQLDLEDERRARLDARGRATLGVRQIGGTDETALLADLHQLQGLIPALDDAVERKRRRLAPLDRAIEDAPVGQHPLIMHLDLVRGLRLRPLPGGEGLDDQAGGGLGHPWLGGRLREVGLPRLLFLGRDGRHPRALQL